MDKVLARIRKIMGEGDKKANLRINLPVNLLKRGDLMDEAKLHGRLLKLVESNGYVCEWFDGKFWLFGHIPYPFRGLIIYKRPLKTRTEEIGGGLYANLVDEEYRTRWLWSRLAFGNLKNIIK